MKKYLRAAAALVLVSCGGGEHVAPRNLDDACSIIDQRPQYLSSLRQTQANWGIPVNVQMAAIYQESKFVSNAKTPRKFFLGFIPTGRVSSAYGYTQALDGTWDDYQKATGSHFARRNQFDDATDFMGWYMNKAATELGIPRTDARDLYLAYHEGIGGYSKGSHNDKAWLLRVADEVGERAETYGYQLVACGKM